MVCGKGKTTDVNVNMTIHNTEMFLNAFIQSDKNNFDVLRCSTSQRMALSVSEHLCKANDV